jgi:thioesterase domain-containing protein
MTDIVERLREYARNCGGPPEDYLTWQAADEIVRLLGICKDKTMLLKDAYADNERLTALHVAAAARAELAQIDNARLRAALQRIADDGKNCADHCRRQARTGAKAMTREGYILPPKSTRHLEMSEAGTIAELHAEIERLLAERINLLNWLNTYHPHVAIAWARAREPKP